MTTIKHVILDHSTHFLVVDGTRGEPESFNDRPAMHPSGYFVYHPKGYGVPRDLKGKLFKVVEDVPVELETVDQCEPAQKAWKDYAEITNECHRVNISRYEPALGAEGKQGESEEVS